MRASAWRADNVIGKAIRALKKAVPRSASCPTWRSIPTSRHGQDGLERGGRILNDETIEVLIKQSLRLAEAGCDVVRPSDSDGRRIGGSATRWTPTDISHVKIMAYSTQ